MPFKYSLLAAIISIGCAIDVGLPAVTFAQVPSAVSSEGETLFNAAQIEIKNQNYPEAIRILEKAVVFFKTNGNITGEANILNDIGFVYGRLGKYSQALEYHRKSLKIKHQIGDLVGTANTLDNIGIIYGNLGNNSLGIDYHLKSLKIYRQIGDYNGQGFILSRLGDVYGGLNQYSESLNYYQQSLKIFHEIGKISEERKILGRIGNIHIAFKKYPEALKYSQQSLQMFRQDGDRAGESGILFQIGRLHKELGNYQEALNYYQQSLNISRQIKNYGGRIDNILDEIGRSYQKLENYPEAIYYHQQALKIKRQSGMRPVEGFALFQLGILHYKLNQLSTAIEYFQQATNINDSLRLNLKDGDKVSLFQTQIQSYKFLASALLLNQDLPGSLIATERGRARAFSDLLARRLEANSTITKPNTLNFAQIQTQAISRRATIVSYSFIPDFDLKSNRKAAKLLIHVISPTGKLTVRESLISSDLEPDRLVDNNRTELLASRSGNKLTIDRLKPKMLVRLNGDEPDTRRQIVTVDPQKQTIVLQGIGQNARETEEVAFSDIAGIALPTDRPELHQLHQLLIAPIADLLPTNPLAPVIFIPDGALYEVPFAALKNERGQYLIDLHTISIAPSLSILAQTAQLKQRNIPRTSPSLVIGNPDFSKLKQRYEQLQFSGDEARGVSALFPSQLLLGDRATESAVKQSLPTARIAHFATHGIRDGRNGLNSGIVLTPSGTDSGILTAEKVLDLKLNADLVVLSACDTGRGQITGDGVIGLSRSFITAGSNSVIVSLWSVDDKATAMLMTDFYRQWQGGKSKAQALRASMLNTKAQYPDPYYWSSMSLYGEID